MQRLQVSVFDTKPYDREYLLSDARSSSFEWRFHEFRLTAETANAASGSEAVCIFVNDRADRECLERLVANGARMLALRCAGFNQVDLAAASELGLRVVRVPAYSPHAVAEHTIGLLLTLNRKIHRAHQRVRELNFSLSGLVGFDVCGKQVGVIGTGRIGKVVAQILRGFEAHVMAYDPQPDTAWATTAGVEYQPLETLLRTSHILTLHLPLVPSTFHLLNRETLAMTRPGVFLINTSRGKLIDTTALIEGLKSKHIGGVALDVYEEEEGIFFEDHSGQVLQDDELARLLSFPNVLMTAHQAFLTEEALREIAHVTLTNLYAWATSNSFLPGTLLNP